MFSFREQRTNNSYRTLRFESFVFTCLTYRNVQRFRNGPGHELYGLKASQMSKFRASSHEYPHVEKSRIFRNRISKVRWPTTVTAKELTSQQKEKPHGKIIIISIIIIIILLKFKFNRSLNLHNPKRITSRQKE